LIHPVNRHKATPNKTAIENVLVAAKQSKIMATNEISFCKLNIRICNHLLAKVNYYR
jgi:hypothetical protein